jgi:hypothetical protein
MLRRSPSGTHPRIKQVTPRAAAAPDAHPRTPAQAPLRRSPRQPRQPETYDRQGEILALRMLAIAQANHSDYRPDAITAAEQAHSLARELGKLRSNKKSCTQLPMCTTWSDVTTMPFVFARTA